MDLGVLPPQSPCVPDDLGLRKQRGGFKATETLFQRSRRPFVATVQGRQCSILVVEDNELLRLTVAEYLRDSGFDVLEASNGDEAIFMLKGDACAAINIVFSDIRMPGSTDGFGLAQWVRVHRPDAQV